MEYDLVDATLQVLEEVEEELELTEALSHVLRMAMQGWSIQRMALKRRTEPSTIKSQRRELCQLKGCKEVEVLVREVLFRSIELLTWRLDSARLLLDRPVRLLLGGEDRELLIVEDETAIRKQWQDMFMAGGYRVNACSTVSEAEAALDGDAKLVCAIVDLRLPDGDGARIIPRLRERESPLPVAVASGCYSSKHAITLRKLGACLMPKPVPAQHLCHFVNLAVADQPTLAKTMGRALSVNADDLRI